MATQAFSSTQPMLFVPEDAIRNPWSCWQIKEMNIGWQLKHAGGRRIPATPPGRWKQLCKLAGWALTAKAFGRLLADFSPRSSEPCGLGYGKPCSEWPPAKLKRVEKSQDLLGFLNLNPPLAAGLSAFCRRWIVLSVWSLATYDQLKPLQPWESGV